MNVEIINPSFFSSFHITQINLCCVDLYRNSITFHIVTNTLIFFHCSNYVAGVRKVDIKKCWPFSPQFLEIKLQKGVDNILPPLVVPTCRYWQCAECVENAVTPDYSNQERNAHKQFDALHSDVLIQNFGNLCTEQLGKEEHISDCITTSVLEAKSHSILEYGKADEKKAKCHVSEDIGSGKASFVCSKNTFHSGDGGAEETKTLQLTGNEIFISLNADALHQSHSDRKTVFNNAASSPTDSELIPPGCRNVCENSNALADEVASERTAEKAEVFPHASTTMDSVEKYRTVNRSDHEDEDDRNTKTERQHFINDNLDRVPCKLIAGCNIDKDDYLCTSLAGCNDNMDDCPTQLSANTGNEESMQKVKKTDCKPLKENGKTQKKHLLADLIATAPSQQIKWDGENQNQASENSPRKARFGTWNKKSIRSQNSFKNGMHGWKEDICEVPSSMLTSFVPEKSHLESLEMIRKRRRLGMGAKSSSSKEFRQVRSSSKYFFVHLIRGWP